MHKIKNIIIFARASKQKYYEWLEYKLPINCGGLSKNIILNINHLKKHFKTALVLLGSSSKENCLNTDFETVPISFSYKNKLGYYFNIFKLFYKNQILVFKNLKPHETAVIIHDDLALALLTKLFQPKITLIMCIETNFLSVFFRTDENIVVRITSTILGLLMPLFVNKIVNIRSDIGLFKTYFRFFNKNVYYLPNGIDKAIFKPCSGDCKEAVGINGLDEDDKVLLYVGRLNDIAYKNPKLLFQSFEILSKESKDIKLVIIGMNKEEASSLLDKYKVNNKNINFLDQISNDLLVHYYQRSDLTLLTSNSEGNPYVILESLSCGTPCVTTNVLNTGVIQHGINGYIVKSKRPKDFALSVLKGLELSYKIKQKRQDLLNSVYNQEHREKLLLDLLTSV